MGHEDYKIRRPRQPQQIDLNRRRWTELNSVHTRSRADFQKNMRESRRNRPDITELNSVAGYLHRKGTTAGLTDHSRTATRLAQGVNATAAGLT